MKLEAVSKAVKLYVQENCIRSFSHEYSIVKNVSNLANALPTKRFSLDFCGHGVHEVRVILS